MRTNRTEEMLLLQGCTTFKSPERKVKIKHLLENDIKWPYLLQMAERHAVMAQLYWNLRDERLPENVIEALRGRFRSNTITSLVLTHQMLYILDLLMANDIPAVPYKGPTLALLAYGDVTLRSYYDLDFFIPSGDVGKAKELLLSRGYSPEHVLTPEQERVYLKNECECNFYSEKNRILVELHWGIVQDYFSCPFDTKDLWDHLTSISVFDRQVMTFSPERLLLILCAHHGAKHQWGHLSWLCDVAQLVATKKDLDWEWVLRTSHRWGMERMLLLGLYLARDLLSVDLPCRVNSKIEKEQTVKTLAAGVETSLFHSTERVDEIKRSLFYLRAREKMCDRFRYVFRRLFTPTKRDWAFIDLPSRLHAFYRLLRPLRLLKKLAIASR